MGKPSLLMLLLTAWFAQCVSQWLHGQETSGKQLQTQCHSKAAGVEMQCSSSSGGGGSGEQRMQLSQLGNAVQGGR
jgi:hypothetical protein